MARVRGFCVPPAHAVDAWQQARTAGDAAMFFDPTLPAGTVRDIARRFGVATLTVTRDDTSDTTPLSDPVTVDDDTALIVLTSGSTGEPKGVELSAAALDAAVTASVKRLAIRPGGTVLQALPTHHVAGLLGILRAGTLGADIKTVTTSAETLQAHGDVVSLVPTQLARLVEAHADLSRLGTILLGGAAAPDTLLSEARALGGTLVTSYGMSETCGGCIYDGTPIGRIACEVVAPGGDVGPIRLRGPQLFRGYRTGRTLHRRHADDWFDTADVGRLTNGRLTVLGRSDEIVVSGGENVPLAAVSNALTGHPDVRDVLVFARPSPLWGNEVLACVVTDRSDDELRTHLKSVLPHSWVPRQLQIVAEIPRTGLGKPDLASARRLFADG